MTLEPRLLINKAKDVDAMFGLNVPFFYTICPQGTMDVGAGLNFGDLEHAGDTYSVNLLFQWRT